MDCDVLQLLLADVVAVVEVVFPPGHQELLVEVRITQLSCLNSPVLLWLVPNYL